MASNVDTRVFIRVGESVFHTMKSTLMESQMFAALFAGPLPPDDEYFVDGDPELFGHILRYLRTKTFPIFYDQEFGHDLHMYAVVLQQAEFYQIPVLVDWLLNRRYLHAVKKSTRFFSNTYVGDMQIKNMQHRWQPEEQASIISAKSYKDKASKCPAGKWEHDGTNMCARMRCPHPSGGLAGYAKHVEQPHVDVAVALSRVEVRTEVFMQGMDNRVLLPATEEDPPPYIAPPSEGVPPPAAPAGDAPVYSTSEIHGSSVNVATDSAAGAGAGAAGRAGGRGGHAGGFAAAESASAAGAAATAGGSAGI